jgi:hypothetical protein
MSSVLLAVCFVVICFVFNCSTGDLTQGLAFARKALWFPLAALSFGFLFSKTGSFLLTLPGQT